MQLHQGRGESARGPDIEEGEATLSAPSCYKCDVISRWQFACVISHVLLHEIIWPPWLCFFCTSFEENLWNIMSNMLLFICFKYDLGWSKAKESNDWRGFFMVYTCQWGLKMLPEHPVMRILPEPWIYSPIIGANTREGVGGGIRYSRDVISQRGVDKLSKLNLIRFLQNKGVQMTELLADRLRHFCGLHSYFLFPLRKVSEAPLVNETFTEAPFGPEQCFTGTCCYYTALSSA